MKIKQIVGEHKKGVKAVKYNAKPQTHIEPPKPRNFVAKNATTSGAGAHKDKKKAAKSGEVKHKAQSIPVSEGEGKVTAVDPTKGVEITNPETGVKTTLPPKMSSALAPDKANPNRYTLNPQAVSGGDEKDTASGPKVGAQVAIPDQPQEEMMVPPSDSQSPIHGGTVDGGEAGNRDHELIIRLLKKLAGVQEMDNGPVSVQVGSKGDLLGHMKKLGGL